MAKDLGARKVVQHHRLSSRHCLVADSRVRAPRTAHKVEDGQGIFRQICNVGLGGRSIPSLPDGGQSDSVPDLTTNDLTDHSSRGVAASHQDRPANSQISIAACVSRLNLTTTLNNFFEPSQGSWCFESLGSSGEQGLHHHRPAASQPLFTFWRSFVIFLCSSCGLFSCMERATFTSLQAAMASLFL